jgi:hypothetical protein
MADDRPLPSEVIDKLEDLRMALHQIAKDSEELLTSMRIKQVTEAIWDITHRNRGG